MRWKFYDHDTCIHLELFQCFHIFSFIYAWYYYVFLSKHLTELFLREINGITLLLSLYIINSYTSKNSYVFYQYNWLPTLQNITKKPIKNNLLEKNLWLIQKYSHAISLLFIYFFDFAGIKVSVSSSCLQL